MRVLAISLVCVAGAVLGWDAAAATHSSKTKSHAVAAETVVRGEMRMAASPSSTLMVVPVPAALSERARQAQEMARLAARNRRLEALVKVLRSRE